MYAYNMLEHGEECKCQTPRRNGKKNSQEKASSRANRTSSILHDGWWHGDLEGGSEGQPEINAKAYKGSSCSHYPILVSLGVLLSGYPPTLETVPFTSPHELSTPSPLVQSNKPSTPLGGIWAFSSYLIPSREKT
ncbi:hypothetical protein Peur_006103 [Populus x canadensis]